MQVLHVRRCFRLIARRLAHIIARVHGRAGVHRDPFGGSRSMGSNGGVCRDNYNLTTKTGFRGLRLYFGPKPPAPAPTTP